MHKILLWPRVQELRYFGLLFLKHATLARPSLEARCGRRGFEPPPASACPCALPPGHWPVRSTLDYWLRVWVISLSRSWEIATHEGTTLEHTCALNVILFSFNCMLHALTKLRATTQRKKVKDNGTRTEGWEKAQYPCENHVTKPLVKYSVNFPTCTIYKLFQIFRNYA
jgi:hypothetical protein